MTASKSTNRQRVRNWRQEQQAKGGRSLSVYLDSKSANYLHALLDAYGENNTALIRRALWELHNVTCNKTAPYQPSFPATVSPEQVLQGAGSGIIATDQEGRVIFINHTAEEIMGIKHGDVLQRPIQTYMPKTAKLVQRCLKSGAPQPGTKVMGKRLNLLVYVTPIKPAGHVLGSVCVFHSMQEIEVIGTQLESYKKLNSQLTAILNASSESVWVCDGDGVVQTINKSCERLLDIKAADVLGKNVKTLVNHGFMDRSSTLEVLGTRRQVNILQYVSKTQKHLLVTSTPVFNDDGEITMVVTNERDMTQLNHLRRELQEARAETRRVKEELTGLNLMELKQQDIIAESPAMQNVLQITLKLAALKVSNVLVLGESGTGKGLVAKILHENSTRKKEPFIGINCAALPDTLLEAELFGYEKGAFTGARREGKPGLFELAKEGTIFLDEIGELPLNVQAKLLKCLDEFEIQRLGGLKTIPIQCVVVAATNRELSTLVRQKKFREDLYYRLNPFTIDIPPLRRRREDILPLSRFYLRKYNLQFQSDKALGPKALEQLQNHLFPGNVRELKNMIKHAVVLQEGHSIERLTLSNTQIGDDYPPLPHTGSPLPPGGLKAALEAYEKKIMQNAIEHCTTTRQLAAYLEISQPSVVRKIKYHNLTLRPLQP